MCPMKRRLVDSMATGHVHQADPARYESLPENDDRVFHTLIRSATIVPGTGVAPFMGDIDGMEACRRWNRPPPRPRQTILTWA